MAHQLKLNLGPALMPDYMTGALFSSILAWPSDDAGSEFHKVSEELAAKVIRLSRSENPAVVEDEMARWPNLNWRSILMRSKKRKPSLGYLEKRLNQRMAAARAGIGKMHGQLFATPAVLPEGMTDVSIDQLCEMIRSDVTIDDPHNIENLVWRTSLPILHLAMATQLMLAERFRDRTTLGFDLQDIDFYRWAVLLGYRLEQAVHDHPEIPMTRERMTLVRWYE